MSVHRSMVVATGPVLLLCLASACATRPDGGAEDARGRGGAPLDAAARRARALVVDDARRRGVALDDADLELRDLGPDGVGGARVRFLLRRRGIPVDGGDLVVVIGADGAARGVSGMPETPAAMVLPAAGGIDAAAATRATLAALAAGEAGTSLGVDEPATLVALPYESGLRAVWRVAVTGERGGLPLRREVFVDATDGSIVHQRQALLSIAARGSGVGVLGERRELAIWQLDAGFELRDDGRGARGIRTYSAENGWKLPATALRSDRADVWDEGVPGAGAAVDGHANAAITYDFLAEVLGRDSWDGEGGRLAVVVHFGDALDNAFWDGRRAIFGDGDGETSLPFSAALDVVAHEIFHGVIASEAGLIYERQPGAINESYADLFGSLVEQHVRDGDWLVGGEVVAPPLRDLERPWRTDSPSHMSEYQQLADTPEDDMGGVHLNSTIVSYAAVLVADGGRHGKSRIEVPAIGRAAMRDIWWRALTIYLAPRARFIDLARATAASAEDLYGKSSREADAVRIAWKAVGLPI